MHDPDREFGRCALVLSHRRSPTNIFITTCSLFTSAICHISKFFFAIVHYFGQLFRSASTIFITFSFCIAPIGRTAFAVIDVYSALYNMTLYRFLSPTIPTKSSQKLANILSHQIVVSFSCPNLAKKYPLLLFLRVIVPFCSKNLHSMCIFSLLCVLSELPIEYFARLFLFFLDVCTVVSAIICILLVNPKFRFGDINNLLLR
jgi:hypothetical protein